MCSILNNSSALCWTVDFERFSVSCRLSRDKTRHSAIAERPRCRVRYSFGQEWKTGTGRQYFTDITGFIFNCCDIIGLKISVEFGEKMQNKGYYGVQGHRGPYQSKARMRLPISD